MTDQEIYEFLESDRRFLRQAGNYEPCKRFYCVVNDTVWAYLWFKTGGWNVSRLDSHEPGIPFDTVDKLLNYLNL